MTRQDLENAETRKKLMHLTSDSHIWLLYRFWHLYTFWLLYIIGGQLMLQIRILLTLRLFI